LILVGGFGTRLRPLTFSKSKPMVEFVNKPILVHQIEALVAVGVKEIVLAVNFQQNSLIEFLKVAEETYKIKLTISPEKEPMGTAGPLALAKEILEKTEGDDFFVFNSDITCKFPLEGLLKFHKNHGREGTIMVTKVEDPSKYGVILSEENGKIKQFIEKPKTFISDRINAGLYILNKKVLNRIKPVPTSIEREIFPLMAQDGELFSLDLEGFWMDIGQPTDYLKGTGIYLDDLKKSGSKELAEGSNFKGNVLIHPKATVSSDALIGPNVVIGPNVSVKPGARIQNSVILSNCIIEIGCYIDGSIIGWKSKLGKWVRIDGQSILGEDVTVNESVYINGSVILPNCTVKESVKTAGSIIMF